MVRPGQSAAVNIAFGQYLMYAFVGSYQQVLESGNTELASWYETYVRCIGVVGILFTTGVHFFSPKLGIRIQDMLTTIKSTLLLCVVLLGGIALCGGTLAPKTSNFEAPFKGTTTSSNAYAAGLFNIFFAFDGWNNLNYCLDELIDPIRNLPR